MQNPFEGGVEREVEQGKRLARVAREAGVHGVMVDTAVKDAGTAWSVMGERALAAFVETGRSLGLTTALAGGLAPVDIHSAMRIGVDILGFRGSACETGRPTSQQRGG